MFRASDLPKVLRRKWLRDLKREQVVRPIRLLPEQLEDRLAPSADLLYQADRAIP